MECARKRYVRSSRKCGPPPERTASAASPAARSTASTSIPSTGQAGIP